MTIMYPGWNTQTPARIVADCLSSHDGVCWSAASVNQLLNAPRCLFSPWFPILPPRLSYWPSSTVWPLKAITDMLRTAWSQGNRWGQRWFVLGGCPGKVHHSSICARHGLIQCQMIHRTHWNSWLPRVNPNIDPTCIRCHRDPANPIPLLWSCPSLTTYCESVYNTLFQVALSLFSLHLTLLYSPSNY